jgi:inorganic triphosphatase YgiF
MASEIELKLEVSPEAAAAIEKSPLLEGQSVPIEQVATYFDTANRALFEAGLSLRIRRARQASVQTIKASRGSTAGLFTRAEWEHPVDGDRPVLNETNPIRALIGEAADGVEPLFEVRIERRTWMVREGDASIELVIDRGEAKTADRTSPIMEIELELKAGAPSSLFAFARRLDAIAPVRVSVLSKSDRGYRLFDEARTAFKAEPVALNKEMSSAEAFQHIVHICVRQFRLNEAMLSPHRRADTLHQARVALRRLRSAFSIFKPIARGEKADRLRQELRRLAEELGDARNLDVLLKRTAPGDLRDRIAAARAETYDRVETGLATPGARALLLDLLEWTATGDWLTIAETDKDRRKPVRQYAERALNRLWRKVKKDGRDLAQADDDARHEVRKDAKKLRYASDFFRVLFDRKRERRRYKRFIASLENLQDQLGALNDMVTAPEVLKRLDLGDDLAGTNSVIESKQALIEAAKDAYEELIDAKRFWY